MRYCEIVTLLADLLADAANGRYTVITARPRHTGAEALRVPGEGEIGNRRVQVIYRGGDFPRSASGMLHSFRHDMQIKIDLTVSAPAVGDLAVLASSESSAAEIETALDGFMRSTAVADLELDELIDAVWNVIMQPGALDFGDDQPLGSRWISSIAKHDPERTGDLVVATATLALTAGVIEAPVVAVPIQCEPMVSMDTEIEIDSENLQKTGVREQYLPEPPEED